MSENIALQDLFKAGLTKEQFLQRYSEIRENANESEDSIFSAEFANSIGMVFDTLNTEGETLEESEIATLKAMSKNDDINILTNNDLKELYNVMSQKIMQSYTSSDPETMYNNANTGVEQVSSTYIQDLGTQIDVLLGLIALRENNSTDIINTYQSQIDDIILKNTKLSNDFKIEYKETSDKLKKLQKEANKINSDLQAKAQEIERAKTEAEIVKREISQLNSEQDTEELTRKQNELNKLNTHIENLTSEYSELESKKTEISPEIDDTRNKLSELTNQANELSNENKSRIEELKNQIKSEEENANNDINTYHTQITTLRKAQAYAINQLQTRASVSNEDYSSFHNNDNLMSFDELATQGLKYSSEKGQKLAQEVKSHAVGFTGYCSRYVSNALARSGLGNERAASAHMMDTKLENNPNFKEIKINSQEELKNLPAGCIIVYEAGAARYNAKHGHIEVSLGNGTAASDGITRNVRYTENMSVFVPVENA